MKKIYVLIASTVIGLGAFSWLCYMDWKIALAVTLMFYANNLNNNLDGLGTEDTNKPTN